MSAVVRRKEKKLSEDTVEVVTKEHQHQPLNRRRSEDNNNKNDDEKDNQKNEGEKRETITFYEHDLREVRKAGQSHAFGFLMTAVLHFYFKLNPPIVLQTIMLPLNMIETPCFRVHVLGRDSKSDERLKRPWREEKPANPFTDLAKAMSPPPPPKTKRTEEGNKKGEDAKRK